MSSGWRWVFSSRSPKHIYRWVEDAVLHHVPNALFSLVFPDDCRVCAEPLREISRIPVCPACLQQPVPLMAEHFCVRCRTPFVTPHPLDEEGLCGLCRRGVNGFDAVYSFGSYEDTLRELIHLLKYGGVRTLAEPLGAMMSAALPRYEQFDVLTPMPLNWRRRWQRGFNQARLLADVVGRRTGLPVRNTLRRPRATASQAGLSNRQRRLNVAGAFRVRRKADVRGLRVLLVDDVFTTGSTASAAAAALKRAGASHVSVLTLARTDRRMWTEPEALAETVAVGASS